MSSYIQIQKRNGKAQRVLEDKVKQAREENDARKPDIAGVPARAEELSSEEQLAAQQWLRRIEDDPGGLLRRKFLYQYRQRPRQPDSGSEQDW